MPPVSSRTRPATVLVLDDFEEGLTQVSYDVSAAQLALQDDAFVFTDPVSVRLSVGRTLQMFTIEARARTAVCGECSRCLAPAAALVEAEFRFLLQRKEGTPEEVEALEDTDDLDIVDPGAREFDLRDRLHDAVVLELPLRLYCKPDCKGLCSQCGQDLNAGACDCTGHRVDPRWHALVQLANQQADSPGA